MEKEQKSLKSSLRNSRENLQGQNLLQTVQNHLKRRRKTQKFKNLWKRLCQWGKNLSQSKTRWRKIRKLRKNRVEKKQPKRIKILKKLMKVKNQVKSQKRKKPKIQELICGAKELQLWWLKRGSERLTAIRILNLLLKRKNSRKMIRDQSLATRMPSKSLSPNQAYNLPFLSTMAPQLMTRSLKFQSIAPLQKNGMIPRKTLIGELLHIAELEELERKELPQDQRLSNRECKKSKMTRMLLVALLSPNLKLKLSFSIEKRRVRMQKEKKRGIWVGRNETWTQWLNPTKRALGGPRKSTWWMIKSEGLTIQIMIQARFTFQKRSTMFWRLVWSVIGKSRAKTLTKSCSIALDTGSSFTSKMPQFATSWLICVSRPVKCKRLSDFTKLICRRILRLWSWQDIRWRFVNKPKMESKWKKESRRNR